MRYLVLRDLQHKNQSIEAGSLLDEKVIKNIFGGRYRMAIRRLMIVDTHFEYDLDIRERSKHRRRMMLLKEIGNAESLSVAEAIEAILSQRIGKEKAAAIAARGFGTSRTENETHGRGSFSAPVISQKEMLEAEKIATEEISETFAPPPVKKKKKRAVKKVE